MGLFDRLGRVIRANTNDLISKAEDPEKILEQALIDMQEQLVQLRQAVARAIAEQKRTEQQYNNSSAETKKWQQRAQLALSKGDENLARQALVRKKNYADTANSLKSQLDTQSNQVQTLKDTLKNLEGKIAEAKSKKNILQARAKAAKANKELQSTLNNIGTSGAMAAFERMEEKVLALEAESQSASELQGSSLEQQFAQLEGGSGVEDELAAMKAQLAGTSKPAGELPSAKKEKSGSDSAVDAELEDLENQFKNL